MSGQASSIIAVAYSRMKDQATEILMSRSWGEEMADVGVVIPWIFLSFRLGCLAAFCGWRRRRGSARRSIHGMTITLPSVESDRVHPAGRMLLTAELRTKNAQPCSWPGLLGQRPLPPTIWPSTPEYEVGTPCIHVQTAFPRGTPAGETVCTSGGAEVRGTWAPCPMQRTRRRCRGRRRVSQGPSLHQRRWCCKGVRHGSG